MKVQIGDEIREMSKDELAAHHSALESAAAQAVAADALIAAKASAKTKLAALGLTEAEITALVGA